MKNGVPYREAMRMSATRRLALIVAFGELDGRVFDWAGMRWEKE